MRVVTWNCNGAFRKKFEELSVFGADIYIIQECENPSLSKHKAYQDWAKNYLWTGDSKNKGLAVFAKETIQLEKLSWSNQYKDHSVKHFLPCKVNGEFDLLAVWTHRNNSPNFGYIGQLWKYLETNKKLLDKTFLIGDFNSNTIWDQWDRWWNHSDVVRELEQQGIVSFYHKFRNELQGEESSPTLYFQRNLQKTYHIDYVFGPMDQFEKLIRFEVGESKKWLQLSDHMPIFFEFS